MEPKAILLVVLGLVSGFIAVYRWRRPSKKPIHHLGSRPYGFFAAFALWAAFLIQGKFPEKIEVVMMMIIGLLIDYIIFFASATKRTAKRL